MKEITFKGKKIYYGWVIVIIAGFGAFFSGPGQTYSVSIFINSYVDGFGWSRSLVSGYYSFATLFAGFLLPFIGRAVDRFGHRKMITIIPTLLALTCIWMSFVVHPLMLFVGFFFLRLMGQGSMSLLPSTLVAQWFSRHRGKALSIMAVGGVIGSAFFPPVNNYLIDHFGAVTGWRVLALSLFVVMVPLGWFFVRDKPEDIGEKSDGVSNIHDIDKHNEENPKKILFHDDPWTLKEAMKTKAYWFLLFCMSVPSMINTGVTFHMVSIMNSKGYDSAFAALLLSIVAMVQFPFTFLAGFIVDRFKVHLIKTIGYSAYFGVLILLMLGQSQFSLILYAILLGIFMAFESVSTNVLWPNYFGRRHQGSIRGTAMTATVIGSALGPLPFGFAFDTLGGYSEIMLIMLIFPVIAALGAFLSPPPLYEKRVS